MVDSICKAWVRLPNFLLFVSGSGRGTRLTSSSYCLHWELTPLLSGRLWRICVGRRERLMLQGRQVLESTLLSADSKQCLCPCPRCPHNHTTRSLPGGPKWLGWHDPTGHIQIRRHLVIQLALCFLYLFFKQKGICYLGLLASKRRWLCLVAMQHLKQIISRCLPSPLRHTLEELRGDTSSKGAKFK